MDRKIFFGGVEMPAPKVNGGLVETYEDVWSANTGRNSAGSMVGTLVATKAKLKFSWNALSWEEAARIKKRHLRQGVHHLHLPRGGRTDPHGDRLFRHPQLQPVQLAGRAALGHRHCRQFH